MPCPLLVVRTLGVAGLALLLSSPRVAEAHYYNLGAFWQMPGSGILNFTGSSDYEFAPINTGAALTTNFGLRNDGTGSLTLGTITDGALGLSAPFSITGGSCATSQVLAPNQSCSLQIQYAPGSSGSSNESLSVSYTTRGISGTSSTTHLRGHTYDPSPTTRYAALGAYFTDVSYFGSSGTIVGANPITYIPQATYLDSTSGLFYVADRNRLHRWDHVTGAYLGWINNTDATFTPTGGMAGCRGATGFSPGWCTGGDTDWVDTNSNGSYYWPFDLTGDGKYLYVLQEDGVQRFEAATGSFKGWIGVIGSNAPTANAPGGAGGCTSATNTETPGWCIGGDQATQTQGGGIWIDSTYIYFTESIAHRLTRWNKSTGAFAGWVGEVGTSGGTCVASPGQFTGGWCIGGSAQASPNGNGGLYAPDQVFGDSQYLYVRSFAGGMVARYVKATGAFAGWIGTVQTPPTSDYPGLGTGCTSASITPHWCVGGIGQEIWYGFEIGAIGGGETLAGDATYLYVGNGPMIQRFDKTTGSFGGWTGTVGSTSGISGCPGATVGASTPGWCTGGLMSWEQALHFGSLQTISTGWGKIYATNYDGTIDQVDASSGLVTGTFGAVLKNGTAWRTTAMNVSPVDDRIIAGDSILGNTLAMFSDGNYLYQGGGRSRVTRFDLAVGAPTGWVGLIGKTAQPSGGAAGCTSTSDLTPGWCIGGTADADLNRNYGAIWEADAIWADGTNLYVYVPGPDAPRIERFDKSTGANTGWIGEWTGGSNADRPTGGAAGCTTLTTSNRITPGWCVGGYDGGGNTYVTGLGDGAFGNNPPQANPMVGDSNYLYVGDGGNYRIQRFNKSTGAFAGWIGRIGATAPTGGTGLHRDCASSVAHGYTPGWCAGGSSEQEIRDTNNNPMANGGFSSIQSFGIDSTYLYVMDNRDIGSIRRYNLATGAYDGYMGQVGATSPTAEGTGMAPGTCTSLVTDDFTHGWCLGGSPEPWHIGDWFNPSYITVQGGYLYASTARRPDIRKISISNGSYVGSKGVLFSTPTGGDTGCLSETAGNYPQGWCRATFAAGSSGWIPAATAATDRITSDSNYIYYTTHGDTDGGNLIRVPISDSCTGTETAYQAHGSGTQDDPWVLCTPAQLIALMGATTDLDKTYMLGRDIDLAGLTSANGVHPIGSADLSRPFSGTFDGAGHSISNMTYTGTTDSVGLFSNVSGTVKNLNVLNANLTLDSDWDIGIVAGDADPGARFVHCSSSGSVNTTSAATNAGVGGIVGWVENDVRIYDSHSQASLTALPTSSRVGGIVGGITYGVTNGPWVQDSYYTGTITAPAVAGGIVGGAKDNFAAHPITIHRTYFSGTIHGGTNGAAGGLIGNAGTGTVSIQDSFTSGDVICSSTYGTANIGSCGRVIGNVGGSVTLNLSGVYYYSSSTISNDGGSGLYTNAGFSGQGTLAGFYLPTNAPLSAWDFGRVWKDNSGNSAFPGLW